MSGYIGTTPVPQATQHREAFTANANQTTFATAGYTVGYIDVWVNGVKLAAADVTVTNGSDIVLASAAAANDIVEYLAFVPFEAVNQTFTGATVVNSLNLNGDGATVTGIKDEDNMASNDANKLATQQSIKAYVDAQVTAQDLDFQGDSGGALSIDLDSETLDIAGGTNITTAGSGNTVTVNIAPLDEDNMASNSATQVASQQSIKAYVDTTVAATNEVVEDTTPQLGGDLASNGNDILMADNDKVIVGTGSDLQLYHSGTYNRSYIQATGTNHDLTISADEIALTNSAISETFATFIADGAVTLYYDNAAKLATTSTGIDVTGTVTSGELLSSVGLKVAGHPVVGYASFDSGYATRLGSTGSSTLNATQIYAGGVAQATFKGGKMGIGDETPTELLEIAGSSDPTLLIRHNTADNASSGKISFRENAGGSTGADLRYDGAANKFIIDTSDVSNAFVINRTDGAATFAGTVTSGDLQATGLYVGSTNTSFDFYNNGTSYLNGATTVDDNLTVGGNVGIGGTPATNTKLLVKAGTNLNFEVENASSNLRLSALNDARSANVGMQFASSAFEFLTGNATFSGTVTVDGGTSSSLIIEKDATGGAAVRFHNAGSQISYIQLDADENMTHYGASGVDQIFYAHGAQALTLTSGAATFAGSITSSGNLIVNTAGNSLPSISLSHSNANADNFIITGGVPGTSNAGFSIRDVDASANRLIIDSSGKVGIGTSSPTRALTVASGGDAHVNTTSSHANGYAMFVSENSSDANNSWGAGRWHDGKYVISHNSAATWSQTGDSERLVIDTSGNVLVGKSVTSLGTAGIVLTPSGGISISESNSSTNLATASGGHVTLANPNSTDGNFSHIGGYNSNSLVTSQINFINLSHSGRTGAITFNTHDGTSMPERMRIDADGHVLVGKTADNVAVAGVELRQNGDVFCTKSSGNVLHVHDTSNYKFYVNANGGIYNYQSNNVNLSDQREKKNIVLLGTKWDAVKAWSVKEFHFNSDADSDAKKLGVIAQDVESSHPELVTEFKSTESVNRKAVKEQQMMWMAIKALQEAQARIEQLETKVTALEA